MIYDSYHWKLRLARELQALRKSLARTQAQDDYEAIEWFVFTSAFIVRKLFDSNRLSYEAEHRLLDATVFLATSRKAKAAFDEIDFVHRYDLEHGKAKQLGIEGLCNQIIHSYDFVVARTSGKGRLIFLNSDRSSDNAIYMFALRAYIKLIEFVVSDDVKGAVLRRDTAAPEKVYKLKMRNKWSDSRINKYFAQFGFAPTTPSTNKCPRPKKPRRRK